ncbi:MAG: energy transducer TonB [Pseudomonadota bacterium]
MGESATFRSEDRAGLAVAVVLHVAVVAVLLFQPVREQVFTPPERITVSLASEVSLEATAPVPVPESRAAIAPTLGEEAVPDTQPQPDEAVPDVAPEPPTPRTTTTTPRAQPTTAPRRTERTPLTPRATPSPRPTNRGGSRVGDDFLTGQGGSTNTDNTSAPAATFGRAERAALQSAITRQLRRHWDVPQGVDAEKLVSIVAWELNPDGSLKGQPRLVRQRGITPSNSRQAPIHAERAIRAIRRAAPFNLPEQFYSRWDDLEWQFDRRL